MRKAGAFILFCLALVACSKVSDDQERPEILRFDITNAVLIPGDILEVHVEASDNEQLIQSRIRVLSAFTKSFGAWNAVQVSTLSGKTFSTAFALIVPDSALAGLYSVGFQVVDERGNASIDSLQYITIRQPGISPELIDFTSTPFLSVSGTNTLTSNDSLIFSGYAAGDSLANVKIEFKSNSDVNIREYVYQLEGAKFWDFAESADTVRFSEFQSLPARMVVRVTDRVGHQDRISFPLKFIN